MKNLLIKLIKLYQKIPGKFHYSCKFYPTCSEYAKQAISKYGCFVGLWKSFIRILKCNPFSKGGYDPLN